MDANQVLLSVMDTEDDDLLYALLDELQQPDARHRLPPFAPVLVNVVRQLTARPIPS